MSGAFYDQDDVGRVAVNLFYGWGYNFYRIENQLRADDQLIRRQTGRMLSEAAAAVSKAEEAHRATMPTVSRANPLPDPTIVRRARELEALAASLRRVEGEIRAMPVPADDRMTQRYRQEAETLQRLAAIDQQMVGHAATIRLLADQLSGEPAPDVKAKIDTHTGAVTALIRSRRDVLT